MAANGAIQKMGFGYSPTRHAPAATIEYRPMADGSAGTFQALEAMRDAVLGRIPPDYSGYRDDFNRWAAEKICAGTGHDKHAQIAALFAYVQRRIRYVPHPVNQQTVQDCKRTLEIGSGDCVSKSVCLATLLASIGHISRFVAQFDGESYSHVYVECETPAGWLALDAVAEDEPMGWSQALPNGGFETTWSVFK